MMCAFSANSAVISSRDMIADRVVRRARRKANEDEHGA
jgi:hypothetical protein